jgi:hypothetical protein
MSELCFLFAGVCLLSLLCTNARKIRKFVRKLFGLTVVRTGSLVVKGEGSVEIELPLRGLDDICVSFSDDPTLPPCDPNDEEDSVTWSFHRAGCDSECSLEDFHCGSHDPWQAHFLKISWKVSSVRSVVWKAFY